MTPRLQQMRGERMMQGGGGYGLTAQHRAPPASHVNITPSHSDEFSLILPMRSNLSGGSCPWKVKYNRLTSPIAAPVRIAIVLPRQHPQNLTAHLTKQLGIIHVVFIRKIKCDEIFTSH